MESFSISSLQLTQKVYQEAEENDQGGPVLDLLDPLPLLLGDFVVVVIGVKLLSAS